MALLDFLWYVVMVFAFVAYLFILFFILTDIFRDHELKGWIKAVWIVALILVPYLTAVVYLIVRGKGMTERAQAAAKQASEAQQAYIRDVAGKAGPADQITQAKALLDNGVISQEEFDQIKSKALTK